MENIFKYYRRLCSLIISNGDYFRIAIFWIVTAFLSNMGNATIPQYGVFEVSLTTTNTYSNPYTDVTILATFQGPTKTVTIEGFWDGNDKWKLRMAPTETGTWLLTFVTSNDGQLDGQSEGATFTCTLPTQDEIDSCEVLRHGFIMVNPDYRHAFIYADGTPFFLMGDTQWERAFGVTNGYSSGKFQQMVDGRTSQGFNVFTCAAILPAYGIPNEGGDPFIGTYTNEVLNPDWWKWADKRLVYMNNAGIRPMIVIGAPDAGFTNNKSFLGRYMRYIIARYAAYDVIWFGVKEFQEWSDANSTIRAIGDTIATYDPYEHPSSTHTGTASTSVLGNDDWLNFNACQRGGSPTGIPSQAGVDKIISNYNSYNKPVIQAEAFYEGPVYSGPNNFTDPEVLLEGLWAIQLHGGWNAGYQYVPDATNKDLTAYLANMNNISADYHTYFKDFFEQTEFWKLVPDNSIVISGIAWAAKQTDYEYVLFLPNGGSITVDLSAASGIFDVSWYDPTMGSEQSDGTATGGALKNFTAPTNNNWVLYLTKQSNDTTPPSAPTGLNANPLSESQIDLVWDTSHDPESGIAYYKLYRDGSLVAQPPDTFYSDTGLNENTTYTYEVSAVNGAGIESNLSPSANATTVSDTTPPMIVSAGIGSSLSEVIVIYSEPVEQNSATNYNNYDIDNGITVSSASFGANSRTITLVTGTHTRGSTYTITVNNVLDRATIPNPIAPNSKVSYTVSDQINVTNLTVASGEPYEVVNGLADDSLVYIDRNYIYSNVPAMVSGDQVVYIKTANDDKLSQGNHFLSFDVSQTVSIYVAHDDRYQTKPDWLGSFTATSQSLTIDNQEHSLFSRTFSGGQVALGGNVHPSEPEDNNMYTVIIVAQSGNDPPPATPTNLTITK